MGAGWRLELLGLAWHCRRPGACVCVIQSGGQSKRSLGQAQILGLKESRSLEAGLDIRAGWGSRGYGSWPVLGRYGPGAVGASLALGWVRSLGT